uniref:Uncharacterized protein n=1 Tax=Romanomermis culicivorax TaxID=13658 RepID=A0A915L2X8_ROMCU
MICNEHYTSGASPSRHGNQRHHTSAWPRHKGRSQANIYNLAINHFVACSAKYHWRTSAVFREVIDTWERDWTITTSSPTTGSSSLFCFAEAKYISRSNSEVGSKYSSLSGNHGRRMTSTVSTTEENSNRYTNNNGIRQVSACCIQ